MKSIMIVAGIFVVCSLPPIRQICAETLDLFSDSGENFTAVYEGSVAWGDYDNDGDLDLILTGNSDSGETATLYRNENGTFNEVYEIFPEVAYSSVAWGDYDNDGDLDLMLTGYKYEQGSSNLKAQLQQNYQAGLYFTNSELSGVSFTEVAYSSVAWGDYDNDGDLDLMLAGRDQNWGKVAELYQNNDAEFNETLPGVFTGVEYAALAWGDYDNDGDLDLMLIGRDTSNSPAAKLYQNSGGSFSETQAGTFTGVQSGSVAWGDYDNDGDLDLILTGLDTNDSPVAKLYRNTDGSFSETLSGTFTGVENGSVAWGDYDNDGDLDLILTGNQMHGFNSPVTKLYQNTGATFNEIMPGTLTTVYHSSVAWADYDNDGDLDLMLTGYNGSSVATLYQNTGDTSNTVPTAPDGLTQNVSGSDVTLSWNAASDTETPVAGLSYNLRVGSASGGDDIMPGQAMSDGVRKLAKIGQVQSDADTLSRPLKGLAPGNYFWSVQAVDTALAGSVWAAEQQFSIESSLQNLSVSVSGNGTVTSEPAGIDCGATCAAEFTEGATVKLTAVPDNDSTFSGWSGGVCSGSLTTCEVTMDAAKVVTATFVLSQSQNSFLLWTK